MAAKIHELRAKLAAAVQEANAALEAAQAKAAEEGRELSAEERAAQDAYDVKIEAARAAYDGEATKNARLALLGGDVPAQAGPVVTDVKLRSEDDPRRGFKSHREFLMAAMENAAVGRDSVDERLQPLAVADKEDRQAGGNLAFMLPEAFTPRSLRAAAGSDEQGTYADPYGGFAVQSSLASGVLSTGHDLDPTAGRTTAVPMTTPIVEFLARTDKDHTTSVSGGFTVSRKMETAAAAASRGQMEMVTLKASSLFGLAYATEEILTDSPISFAAIIAAGFAAEFPANNLKEKIRGNGGNEFLGALNSPAKIEVAKETSQTAATINATNLIKMEARLWGDGIWIANQGAKPQLRQAAIVVEGSVGGGLINVYSPSLREGMPDMLLGKPIFYSEFASALGSVGDIMLVNWSQYLEALYQPLQSAESVHVRFVEHERAYKFWLRNAGAPWWRAALTPHKGADSLSPIVTLAVRA